MCLPGVLNPQDVEKQNAVNTRVWAWSPKAWTLVTAFLVPHPCAICCTKTQNTVNTSVLGMVAKDMEACDNVSCSTSFAQCFGHGRNMNDDLIPTPHPHPPTPPPSRTTPEKNCKNKGQLSRSPPTIIQAPTSLIRPQSREPGTLLSFASPHQKSPD